MGSIAFARPRRKGRLRGFEVGIEGRFQAFVGGRRDGLDHKWYPGCGLFLTASPIVRRVSEIICKAPAPPTVGSAAADACAILGFVVSRPSLGKCEESGTHG